MLYTHKFFKDEKSAQDHKNKHRGILYSNLSGSSTQEEYQIEAHLAGLSESQQAAKPFCVVWNVVDEGPIQPEAFNE